MKSKNAYIISGIIIFIGILLFLINVKNIPNNSIFNKDYVNDSVNEMRSAHSFLGYSFDSDIYKSIYQKRANSGNVAIIGIVVIVIGGIALFASYLTQLKIKNTEKQTEMIGQYFNEGKHYSIEDRLIELSNLKQKGLITEDEYCELRNKALNE